MHDKQSVDGPVDRSPAFFNKLTASLPGVIFTYWLSADGREHCYPYVSDQVRRLFGIEPAALQANADAIFAIIHPEDAGGVRDSIEESAANLTPWKYRARLRVPSGEYQWFEAHSEAERQGDGSTLWFGQFHNIQHYKTMEQVLRDSEAEFSFQAGFQRLIARLSTEFINLRFGTIDECIGELLRAIGEFFAVDRSYLYDFSDEYLTMTNTHEWVRPGVPPLIDTQQAVPITDFRWWHEQIGGMVHHNRVVFIPDVAQLPAEAGEEKALLEQQGVSSMFCVPVKVRGRVTGFFGVDSLRQRCWREDQADLLIIVSGLLSGALERHRLEQELLNQSIRDPLTGLHNRRYLMPRLYEMLGRAARDQEAFAVAMFDIDHFKRINDSLGHLGGDFVLTEFARLLEMQTRATDVVARFGGEEFVVAFVLDEADEVSSLVGRILQAVRSHEFIFEGLPIDVTASAGIAGIADLPAVPSTPDPVIGKADHHLYLAKQAGRDCFVDASGTFRI
ncbi:MAG: diguanylate cyclase [Pseudomonadota bacterium]